MSMETTLEAMVDGLSSKAPQPDKRYMGEDGLMHCAVCGDKVEKIISIFGKERKVGCICRCRVAERKAENERMQAQERQRQRRICFTETNMIDWTFENDDRRNAKISDAMMRYAENFADFRKDGRGLLLYGSVGTGKTYYAACIANRLIDKGYTVHMTNFSRLINQIQGTFEGKNQIVDSLNRYSLLIIDDLGAERTSEYMQEQVFNIVDSRYRSGLPMIVTTNLTGEELKNPKDIGFSRIYDRILERCFPVAINGVSRRRSNLAKNFEETKSLLGL